MVVLPLECFPSGRSLITSDKSKMAPVACSYFLFCCWCFSQNLQFCFVDLMMKVKFCDLTKPNVRFVCAK